jgi:hypothetical protein
MSTKPDFVIYDRDGRLAVAVGVKARRVTSSRWAAEMRHSLVTLSGPGPFRGASFVILAALDRVYIWKETRAADEPVPADYELNAELVFAPYLGNTRWRLEEIGRDAFELVVMSWLNDLILQAPGSPHVRLEGSGILEATKDGRIEDLIAA